MIKIGIIEDHRLLRESLVILVETFDGMEVVLEASNGIELLNLLPGLSIDLILLDLQMPIMNGFETCPLVRSRYPNIKILILSQLDAKASIRHVMNLGAHGFYSKSMDPAKLKEVILGIHGKDFYSDGKA